MCESSAYLLSNGQEELVLEDVETLEEEGGTVTLTNIFGERKHLQARVKSLSLVDHKILLEET
ncbi:MAG: CooT family nickel-binding protein [Deltaproteobacteria bacterium]|nr:CooT family nickel-binding protein [Deltaproteobacteria bacterium]MBW1949851.1 CooT family nickel-binding protein [Deltaproteobacteria bacterium]MBW2008398.1 CooT family nickel-binding protein [Deltaproteobacteria bacterium]